MPSGKTHQAVGGVLGILYAILFHQPIWVVFSSIVGALLPDIDHKHSKIGRYTFFYLFLNHRGFTHTIWALLLCTFVSSIFLPFSYAIAFAIGYASHLFLDSLTPQGINLWKGVRKR